MNSRHIIAQAWQFTGQHKKLMWWYAFIPALLTTLIGILYMAYQFFAFKTSPLFDNAPRSFLTQVITTTVEFFQKHDNFLFPALLTALIILLLYALLPTITQGGLIQLIAKYKKGESPRPVQGISLGLLVFLPLIEYHLLIKTFSIFSLLTEAAFIVRNLGTGALKTLLPIFILAALIGFVLTLLFTYSEFFIVLDKKPVLRSMGRSAKLVILSWQHTFLIGILMIIIGIRIIINILAVLLVPTLLFFSAGFLISISLGTAGLIVGVIVSLIGLFVASYFTGIINVFANAVWTFTFLELMEEKQTQEFMNDENK